MSPFTQGPHLNETEMRLTIELQQDYRSIICINVVAVNTPFPPMHLYMYRAWTYKMYTVTYKTWFCTQLLKREHIYHFAKL